MKMFKYMMFSAFVLSVGFSHVQAAAATAPIDIAAYAKDVTIQDIKNPQGIIDELKAKVSAITLSDVSTDADAQIVAFKKLMQGFSNAFDAVKSSVIWKSGKVYGFVISKAERSNALTMLKTCLQDVDTLMQAKIEGKINLYGSAATTSKQQGVHGQIGLISARLHLLFSAPPVVPVAAPKPATATVAGVSDLPACGLWMRDLFNKARSVASTTGKLTVSLVNPMNTVRGAQALWNKLGKKSKVAVVTTGVVGTALLVDLYEGNGLDKTAMVIGYVKDGVVSLFSSPTSVSEFDVTRPCGANVTVSVNDCVPLQEVAASMVQDTFNVLSGWFGSVSQMTVDAIVAQGRAILATTQEATEFVAQAAALGHTFTQTGQNVYLQK